MSDSVSVRLKEVSKTYGDVRAVSGLSLEIESGQVYGLLGPNGSGKTTVLKMIMGLVKPDTGGVTVNGLALRDDPVVYKRDLGYVSDPPMIYEYLTGYEYLDFVGRVYSVDQAAKERRIREFLKAFELEGRENDMVNGYSHGMKQKIAIIGAVLHRPRMLVMDEPLGGLDPKSARIVKDLLGRLASEGSTTVLSTHALEIADALCDRLCVIHKGEKIAEGTPAEIHSLASSPGSSLEDVFLELTEVSGIDEIVDALAK
jgi:ABC-2 type transport system ATP-binding protein